MMSDIFGWDFVKFLAAVCGLTCLLMLPVAAASILGSRASCYAKWEPAGFPVSWGLNQGCLIQVDGRWIPEDRYLVIK